MNEIQVFKNQKFGQVRTVDLDGKIYFVGADVARALGYQNSRKALSSHCKGVTKWYIPTSGGQQEMNIIPEGDVYRLIVSSHLPKAQEFESWVFDTVLPSIRQNGSYGCTNDMIQTAADQIIAVILTQIPTIINETIKATLNTAQGTDNTQIIAQPMEIDELWARQVVNPQSKVESFPCEIRDLVDGLLKRMKEDENFNYSMIARLCTLKGYTVTSPTIKRYYDLKFGRM